jgi:hypothetical protein
MLLSWNRKLANVNEPMLFPIFGRGRVVPPAIGEEICAEAIRDMAEFLTGACSCEVKEMNPGYDLLLAANWASLVGSQDAAVPVPPLVSISGFAAAAATNAKPNATAPERTTSLSAAVTNPPTPGRDHLRRNLVIVLGIGAASLALATLLLMRRSSRKPGD